jgi:hypothetical protein
MRHLTIAATLTVALAAAVAASSWSEDVEASATLSKCDKDGDGHNRIGCAGGDDCDDNDAKRYPGAVEVCDALDRDEDCNPSTFGVRDADGDGHPDARCCNVQSNGRRVCGTDCNDAQPGIHRSQNESCNGVDDDCDGATDEGVTMAMWRDGDGDLFGAGTKVDGCPKKLSTGFVTNDKDCDDGNVKKNPLMGCVTSTRSADTDRRRRRQ